MEPLLPYSALLIFGAGIAYNLIKQHVTHKNMALQLTAQEKKLNDYRAFLERKIELVEQHNREKHDTLILEIGGIKTSLAKMETSFDFIKQALSELRNR